MYPELRYCIFLSGSGLAQHASNFRQHVLRRSIWASLMEMPYSIYHLRMNRILPSLLSKSVALCYRKYGDSNLIIYTHRTSWMISSYATPPHRPPFPAATLKIPSCSFVARLSFHSSYTPCLLPFVLHITHIQSISIQTENQDSSYLYGNYNFKNVMQEWHTVHPFRKYFL